MAKFFEEPSRTFSEYLLIPGYTSEDCTPDRVSLKTPIVKFKKGEEPSLSMNIPMVSAVMQAVSGEEMACALAREGGISFIFGSQSVESQAAMVRKVKATKAGFVGSDSNISPEATLADVIALKEKTGHSTMAVTDNGEADGKLVGIVTSRDYRISRMDKATKVKEFMTPFEKLIVGKEDISLSEANDLIWDHKLNQLPIVDDEQHLKAFVFRKDYESHKDNPNELLDADKRYIVGAGINTRDYETRVPALVDAGVDILCIDSSEGYSAWQANTIKWIREKYGDTVKVGAGNVVDEEGFRFLAEAGADFVKIGIGGGSICITREQKGIGRGQATATLDVARARDKYFEETGEVEYKSIPTRFEAGTPPIAEVIGLGAAIDYLQSIGMDKISEYEKELKGYLVSKLEKNKKVIMYNKSQNSGILAFNLEGIFSQDTAIYLDHYNICVRAGNHCAKILKDEINIKNTCRISLYFYNTKEEIDKLVEVLGKSDDLFKIIL